MPSPTSPKDKSVQNPVPKPRRAAVATRTPGDAKALYAQKQALEAQKQVYTDGLPHLYGFPLYGWAKGFIESTNRMNLICAANQISKSSTQIRKHNKWATSPSLWPTLWSVTPRIFWYLYPSREVATVEFETKWIPEFMPREPFKSDPIYGWEAEYEKGYIKAIHWNSGITTYFKSYSQGDDVLQTATVAAIFCFPAGTPVVTSHGDTPIEQIRVGDTVLSHRGWKKVTKVYANKGTVLTRRLQSGRVLRATAEHPYFTYNRGWVRFCDLRETDHLATVPWINRILSWFSLRVNCTGGTQSTPTPGKQTISEQIQTIFSTLRSGLPPTRSVYPKALWCITRILTPWTTLPGIWFASRAKNILESINSKSGGWRVSGNSLVRSVGYFSSLVLQNRLSRAIAVSDAGRVPVVWRVLAWLVGLYSKRGPVVDSVSARQAVPTETSTVYNLEVEDAHTYFADGILVHNCDEELPEDLYSELNSRLIATDGYFHMVFTATLNQDMWRRALEGTGEQELFPDAYKQQISMYDCLFYANGQQSPWTIERIKRVEATCSSQTEIDRRVHGKFVTEVGRKFANFDATKHFIAPKDIPHDWRVYPGLDVGSGDNNHPGAIVFVAINPAGSLGWVVDGWRGDGERTTAGDILDKYVEMSRKWAGRIVVPAYDHHNRDMATLAERAGIPLIKANKAQDYGTGVVNTLFKNGMLFLFDTPELRKLGSELVSLMKATPKTKAKDDFCDALRYAAVTIAPWDWEKLNSAPEEGSEKDLLHLKPLGAEAELAQQIRERRGEVAPRETDGWGELDDECDLWNEAYG